MHPRGSARPGDAARRLVWFDYTLKMLAQQVEEAQHMEKLCERFDPQGGTQKKHRASLKAKTLAQQYEKAQQDEKAREKAQQYEKLCEFMGVKSFATQSTHAGGDEDSSG